MDDFIQMRFRSEWRDRYGLPDIGYPVPCGELEAVVARGAASFAELLYWLQVYAENHEAELADAEAGMGALIGLAVSGDSRPVVAVRGDTWGFEAGPVDPAGPIVTIQRGDRVLALIGPTEDYGLRVAVNVPLDAKAIRYILGLSCNPVPDGCVCMRPNNWEYALDQASRVTAAFYARENGTSYLSIWDEGLGILFGVLRP